MKRFSTIAMYVVPVLLILVVLLLIGCSSLFGSGQGATTPTEAKVAPPWLAADSTCQLTQTSAQSRGDPHSYDSAGKATGLLPQGQVTCVLEIQVCGDMIVKSKVVNTAAKESCPDNLHYSHAPNTKVCCAKWNEAKRTKIPCDPLADIDCDGAANSVDDYPLDFAKQY